MGREVKRVEAGFDFPIDETWGGYLNPHYRACDNPDCDGGQLKARWALERLLSLLAMLGDDKGRRGSQPHPWLVQSNVCTELVDDSIFEFLDGLAGRKPEPGLFGAAYGAGGWAWDVEKRLLELAGVGEDWGKCAVCDGEGIHPDAREFYEAWKPTEPPAGEWYQVWQTVSEGGPITPAFETAEECARWISTPGNSKWMGTGDGYEMWLKFLKGPGWAPSMMMTNGVIEDGVTAVTKPD